MLFSNHKIRIAICDNNWYNNNMEFIEFLIEGDNFKSKTDVKFLNPLVMAFVGDSVFSLYIKTKTLNLYSNKVKDLTKQTAEKVNAKKQEQILFEIIDILTEEEKEVVRRARNANIHTKAKNYTIEQYRHATALEALIGYLYLTKNIERLKEILNYIK